MKQMKKICAVLLALVLVFTMSTGSVAAEITGGTAEESVTEAVAEQAEADQASLQEELASDTGDDEDQTVGAYEDEEGRTAPSAESQETGENEGSGDEESTDDIGLQVSEASGKYIVEQGGVFRFADEEELSDLDGYAAVHKDENDKGDGTMLEDGFDYTERTFTSDKTLTIWSAGDASEPVFYEEGQTGEEKVYDVSAVAEAATEEDNDFVVALGTGEEAQYFWVKVGKTPDAPQADPEGIKISGRYIRIVDEYGDIRKAGEGEYYRLTADKADYTSEAEPGDELQWDLQNISGDEGSSLSARDCTLYARKVAAGSDVKTFASDWKELSRFGAALADSDMSLMSDGETLNLSLWFSDAEYDEGEYVVGYLRSPGDLAKDAEISASVYYGNYYSEDYSYLGNVRYVYDPESGSYVKDDEYYNDKYYDNDPDREALSGTVKVYAVKADAVSENEKHNAFFNDPAAFNGATDITAEDASWETGVDYIAVPVYEQGDGESFTIERWELNFRIGETRSVYNRVIWQGDETTDEAFAFQGGTINYDDLSVRACDEDGNIFEGLEPGDDPVYVLRYYLDKKEYYKNLNKGETFTIPNVRYIYVYAYVKTYKNTEGSGYDDAEKFVTREADDYDGKGVLADWGNSRDLYIRVGSKPTLTKGKSQTLPLIQARRLTAANETGTMQDLFQIKSGSDSIIDLTDFTYSTAQNGEYKSADDFDFTGLKIGDKLYIKASVSGEAVGSANAVTITKQPVYLRDFETVITFQYAPVNTQYAGGLAAYPVMLSGCVDIAMLTDEELAALGIAGSNMTSLATANVLNTANINNQTSGSTTTSLKTITVSGNGKTVEVRSSSAITYQVKAADKVEFKDLTTNAEVADTQYLDDIDKPVKVSLNEKKESEPSWYLVTNEGLKDLKDEGVISKAAEVADEDYYINLKTAHQVLGEGDDPSVGSVLSFYAEYASNAVNEKVKITLDNIKPVVYTGLPHVSTDANDKTKKNASPDLGIKVTETLGEQIKTLEENVDYTVKYVNNKTAAGAGDAKAPAVTITGIGAYKGLSLTQKYTILPKDLGQAGEDLNIVLPTSYKYTAKGIVPAPTVYLDGKKLTQGEKKDYVFTVYTADDDKAIDPLAYKNFTETKKFYIRITGKNNYSGVSVNSDTFYGVPSSLTPLKITPQTAAITYGEKSISGRKYYNESVSASDFYNFTYGSDTKTGTATGGKYKTGNKTYVRSFEAEELDMKLYTYDSVNGYQEIAEPVTAAGTYYLGVKVNDEESAIQYNTSPARVYTKVTYSAATVLKANMFTLSQTKFDYDGDKKEIVISPKKGTTIDWDNLVVKAEGSDGSTAGGSEVEGEGKFTFSLGSVVNDLPGKYTITVTPKDSVAEYSGSAVLTYTVNPIKPVLTGAKQNLSVSVDPVSYNAAGYTGKELNAVIKYTKGETVAYVPTKLTYKFSGLSRTGGTVAISNIKDAYDNVLVSGTLKVKFTVNKADLKGKIDDYDEANPEYGDIRAADVIKSTKKPVILEQYGPNGWVKLAEGTDYTYDKSLTLEDDSTTVEIQAVKGKNENKGGFTILENTEVNVRAYDQLWNTKGKNLNNPTVTTITLFDSESATTYTDGKYSKKTGNYKYTGRPVIPGVTVKDAEGTVISDNYYDLTYSNNTDLSAGKSVASVTITFKPGSDGKYPYGGSRTLTYNIVKDYSQK